MGLKTKQKNLNKKKFKKNLILDSFTNRQTQRIQSLFDYVVIKESHLISYSKNKSWQTTLILHNVHHKSIWIIPPPPHSSGLDRSRFGVLNHMLTLLAQINKRKCKIWILLNYTSPSHKPIPWGESNLLTQVLTTFGSSLNFSKIKNSI